MEWIALLIMVAAGVGAFVQLKDPKNAILFCAMDSESMCDPEVLSSLSDPSIFR